MNMMRHAWARARTGLAIGLLLMFASGLLYPGGTVRDGATRGYSFTRNFLSELGSTVACNDQRNVAGAVVFGIAGLIGVLALVSLIAAIVRLLSAAPGARSFARLAAVVGLLACAGFLGAAIAPEDRLWNLHALSGKVAFRSFPVFAALLALATARDRRFRARAAAGWAVLSIVIVGIIAASLLGPGAETDRGLMTQVILQKIMVASIVAVLWFESREAERASGARTVDLP